MFSVSHEVVDLLRGNLGSDVMEYSWSLESARPSLKPGCHICFENLMKSWNFYEPSVEWGKMTHRKM